MTVWFYLKFIQTARLNKNCFIHAKPGRRKNPPSLKDPSSQEESRQMMAAHYVFPKKRGRTLERMVGPWERRKHYFVDDIYAPYRVRWGRYRKYEKPECLP